MLSDKCIADEIPFEIPEGWEWARLGSLCDFGKCQNIEYGDVAEGVWNLDLEDIEKDTGIILRKKRKIAGISGSTKHIFASGMILYSKLRPYLNKVVIADEDGVCSSEILPLYFPLLSTEYVQITLMEPSFVEYAKECSYGVKMPRLGIDDGKRWLIPLPPLAEQHRIVERINQLMPLVEEYGELEDAREKLDATLPDRLRKSVLQMAVQGKLVPQDHNDEPASALLQRIRKERAKLVAEGKAKFPKGGESVIYTGSDGRHYEKRIDKKGRVLSDECIENEIPFEIPDSWAWARFTEMVPVQYGFPADSSKFVVGNSIGLIRIRDVNSGDLIHTSINYSGEWTKEYLVRFGDDLIGMDGDFVCRRWKGSDALLNQRVCCLRYLDDSLDRDFISYAINWYLDQIWRRTSKTTVKHLSAKALDNLLFAVPPIEEQRRIAQKALNLIYVLH